MRARTAVRLAALALLLAVALLAALVLGALTTERGARTAVALAARLVPGRLAVEHVEGTLARRLSLGGVHLSLDDFEFDAGEVRLAWRPRALARGEVHVVELVLDTVAVALPAADEETAAPPPRYPDLPLGLRIDHAAATDVVLRQGEAEYVVGRVAMNGVADRHQLRVTAFELDMAPHAVRGGAVVENVEPPHVTLDLELATRAAERPLDVHLAASGTAEALLADITLRGDLAATVTVELDLLADPPRFDGRARLAAFEPAADVRLGPLSISTRGDAGAVQARVQGALVVAGQPPREVTLDTRVSVTGDAPLALDGELSWQATAAAPATWPRLAGRARFAWADQSLTLEHVSEAPVASTLDVKAGGLDGTPRLAGRLLLETLDLQPVMAEPLMLERAQIEFDGPADDLALRLAASATHPRAGALALDGNGRLGRERFTLDALDARLLGGTLRARGDGTLGEQARARIELTGDGLNLARLVPELETRLTLGGVLQLESAADGPRVAFDLERLSGAWRGAALSARGAFSHGGGRSAVERLHAELADNVLDLDGTLTADAVAARFTLHAADLGLLAPGLGGVLDARGSVSGRPRAPALAASVSGRGLRFADLRIANVDGAVDLDSGQDVAAHVALTADGIEGVGADPGRATLALDGTTGAHGIRLDYNAGPYQVQAQARGRYAGEAWDGALEEVVLELETLGRWTTTDAAPVHYDARGVSLGRVCLAGAEGDVCVALPAWSASDGNAELEARGLPLALAADYLPQTLTVGGRLDARASLERRAGTLLATGNAALAGASLTLDTGEEDVETIAVRGATVDLVLDAEQATLIAHADVADWFGLDGEITLGRGDEQTLAGRLRARSEDLGWLAEFVPVLAGSDARMALDARLGGTRAAPAVEAKLDMTGGALVFPDSGARVSTLTLDLRNRGEDELVLTGAVGAAGEGGRGLLRLDGSVGLDSARGWPGRLHAAGEDIAVVRLPDAEADVTPDLTLDFSAQHLDIRGSIALPRVAVNVTQLPEAAVEVSGDEVVIGENGAAAEETPGGSFFVDKVTGEVDVRLGDAVTIAAAGLDARLTGGIKWSKQRGDRIGRGEGRVSIAEGGYQAYGQNLVIERGHLTFAGPLDNPALDVRAARPGIDVFAGVAVNGNVRAPKFDLFSEPAMPDSEILAWIVTGHGLDDASSGEAGLIARAALSLGAERSSMVTSQVQDAFGLDEFGVNTGDTAADTSFTAGKRLTPRLSVRSTFNPFDHLWSFFLNYKLTPVWSLEAESGVRQGADVIYTIERDTLLPDDVFDLDSWLE